MNFLLRPWTTPKLELTAIDEIVGGLEVIVVLFIVIFIGCWSMTLFNVRRLRK